MRYFQKTIVIIFVVISLLFEMLNSVFAVSDSANVTLKVTSECNHNGVCEPALGETEITCPSDCGCNNNGICEEERGENASNCADCQVSPKPPAGPDILPPEIKNLVIKEITLNSAVISWRTNERAKCKLFWGKTAEYKDGIVAQEKFLFKHELKLINLSPATLYNFKIVCEDKWKNESETPNQTFKTLTPPDITPPANVSDFSAVAGDGEIKLSWRNPPDADFEGVMIVRSTKFYPSAPWEGKYIYSGKATEFTDTGLINGVRYYYSAFAYDKNGNFSSGAIVSAVPQKPVPPEKGPVPVPPTPPEKLPPKPAPPEVQKIKLTDFTFLQEGEKVPLVQNRIIEADIEKPLSISIDYEKVPEVLKTIMVTLEKQDKYFSFLLRINREKTSYCATILPPQEEGKYPLTITIFDYKNQSLKRLKGELVVKGKKQAIQKKPALWQKKALFWKHIIYVLGGLVFLIIIILFWQKRKHKRKIEIHSL